MDRRLGTLVAFAVLTTGLLVAGAGGAAGQSADDCAFPVTATDATGTSVTVSEDPDRVVALAPSAAQQLWGIDAAERVVGLPINEYTAYLDGRDGKTNVVGDDGQPVQETVVGLEPDLVLAPNVIDNATVASLREAGLTVYRYREARSLDDVATEIERTGRLVGECEAARAASEDLRETAAEIREAVAGEDRPRVYYDLGGGWTAGEGTFVDDLIQTAGGDNVARQANIDGYDTISQEVIAEADPEVLVVHEGADVPSNPAIDNSTAIREGNVVRIDANYINQPGQRNAIPLRQLAAAFHPTALETEATDRATPTGTDATVTTAADATTAAEQSPTAGADGPGFTVVGAAIALAVVGSLARRFG